MKGCRICFVVKLMRVSIVRRADIVISDSQGHGHGQ